MASLFQRLFLARPLVPVEKQKIPLNHVYTGQNGCKWYCYADLTTIPVRRMLNIEAAATAVAQRLTPVAFAKYLEKMQQFGNTGQIGKLLALVEEMAERQKLLMEINSYRELCAHFAIKEGEDVMDANTVEFQQKLADFKADTKLEDFFFELGRVSTESFPNMSVAAMRTYFAQTQAAINMMSIKG